MHEAGIEPDWVIGTSIGAINAALIAGNSQDEPDEPPAGILGAGRAGARRLIFCASSRASPTAPANLTTMFTGHSRLLRAESDGVAELALATWRRERRVLLTSPLQETLGDLVDLEHHDAARCGSRSARSTCATARCAISTAATRPSHRPRARVRRSAAGVSRRAHRWRSVLGRRHLFEYADRGGARRQAAPGFGDLHRATCGTPKAPTRSRCGR